ncbi:MAG: aldehyde ferredoxin oxidoreductase family protein, partial [Planctomycetaceae bacterium]|nr:aldehyde ferredoxin oxidoreductase family protein [Planctomycetaceae bacterium]
KFAVMARSPLTGCVNDSLSSSGFAISGKKTGYDAFVITGCAVRPTCLVIEPDNVRFEDATDLWGRSLPETEQQLASRLGASFRTAAIGPAGENLVSYATVSHDGRHAGRGGLGAVMGAKQLKAIAVRGDRTVPYAHAKELTRYSRELSKKSLGPATEKYRELGTVSNLMTFNRLGTLPTRNFQQGEFEAALELSPDMMAATGERTRRSCAACTIGCEHIFPRQSTEGKPASGVRMEYENLFALGPLCGIADPEMVLAASAYCDEAGLDTISAGGTIAFAMECAEKGLLRAAGYGDGLVDGEPLAFGNGQALLGMLQQIAHRRGLGELLAQGSRAAAREIGQGAEDFAPQVKGLELPGYEPRALQTMALGFAVGTRGADHNRSGAYQVDFSAETDRFAPGRQAVAAAIVTENEAALMDALILCRFLRGVFDDRLAEMAEMLRLVTGWDVTSEELNQTAERIVTQKKLFNIRMGWQPADDRLPERFFTQALPAGASSGAVLSRERLWDMILQYNQARGWTDEGWVPPERLEALGIAAAPV